MRKLFAFILIPLMFVAGCGGGGGGYVGGGGGGGGGGGPTCVAESATTAQQLPNPVTLLATDNNGVIVQLPPVPAAGAANPTGSLVFGIGTETNNGLSGATKLSADPSTGDITATLHGTNYPSYLDSGSNGNFFPADSALQTCPSPNDKWYCPTSIVNETPSLQGPPSVLAVNFNVENANTLFSNSSFTAFNDLAGPNSTVVDLGLSFFFGQNIFTGFENLTTAAAPYFAVGGTLPTATPGPPNVETLTVDGGPTGLNPTAVNSGFVSVKICVPGTTTCEVIDHVEVDTGSIGLRLISSQVSLSLPAVMDSSNRPLAECIQFADGTSWGSLATADVTLPVSGVTVKNVNIHVIGATSAGSPPASCTGQPENTVNDFGANGILGVGPFVNDCNSGGDCMPGSQSANYYYCH